MFKSLKTKLIVLMCVLLAASLSTLVISNMISSSAMLRKTLEDNAQLQAENLTDSINQFFGRRVTILQTMAGFVSGNEAADIQLMASSVKSFPEFETFFFSYDLSGKRIINAQGKVNDISTKPHFIEAAKGEGKIIISEPTISVGSGKKVITMVAPLMKDGKMYGYIGAPTDIETIQKEVSQTKFGESGFAFLTSINGLYVWHPNDEFVLKKPITESGSDELTQAFQAIRQGSKGVTLYKDVQGESLLAYAPSQYRMGVYVSAPTRELYAPISSLTLKLTLVSVATLLISSLLVYLLAVRLTRPIEGLNKAVNVIAHGDLTLNVEVKGRDEVAQLSQDFNQTVANLKALIGRVSHSSGQVEALSGEVKTGVGQASSTIQMIAASIDQIAAGANTQARSCGEVATAMEEMALGIARMVETSANVSEAAQEAARQAETGSQTVARTVSQMNNIREGTSQAFVTIGQLTHRSQEIQGILEIISSLSSQINLLALNASIEAARAGEHGRGFSVVASEVKKLATESADSVGHIAALIKEIQLDTSAAEAMIRSNKDEAEQGLLLIERVKEHFAEILESSRNVAGHIIEVSATSEQMSAGSQQVSASTLEMNDIAIHAAADSQKAAQAAREQLDSIAAIDESVGQLNQVVRELQNGLNIFRL